MALAFAFSETDAACAWEVRDMPRPSQYRERESVLVPTLLLYSTGVLHNGHENLTRFLTPFPRYEIVTKLVWAWLETVAYGPQPDHDGSNGKGWRVFNEAWGHVAQERFAFCAIQPVWAMYEK